MIFYSNYLCRFMDVKLINWLNTLLMLCILRKYTSPISEIRAILELKRTNIKVSMHIRLTLENKEK